MLIFQWKINSFARSELFIAAEIDKIYFWTISQLVKNYPLFRDHLYPHTRI
jgi:hypothetical protein